MQLISDPPLSTAFIGLGSNIGDGPATLARAWQLLGTISGISTQSISHPYLTSPVNMASTQWFTNAVGQLSTTLSPTQLLQRLLEVEVSLGRDRRLGDDRTIDLDLLSYDDLILNEPQLTLPHPELHKRLFVLAPLAELDSDWRHPVLQLSVAQLLQGLVGVDQQIKSTDWPS